MRVIIPRMTTKLARCMRAKRLFIAFLDDIKDMMHDTYSFLRFKEEISKVFIHLDGIEERV